MASPFSSLPGVTSSSWYSDFLPNLLWACILTSFLDRSAYLALFRSIISNAVEIDEARRPVVLAHNHLAGTSAELFDQIFRPILHDENARTYLRALVLVDCLPDKDHWERHLEKPEPRDLSTLAHAVADNFDHQSERATDVRWMKAVYAIVGGRFRFPSSFAEMLDEFRLYPDKGDMRKVRPAIRSFEMSIRNFEIGMEGFSDRPPKPLMGETFWAEMKSKSECSFPTDPKYPTQPSAELRDELMQLMQETQVHFDRTLVTTDIDPRHDGAFGIVLFAMSYLLTLTAFYGHDFPYSRVILRSIVEAFITLEYLGTKDDPSLWGQYRRYGAGQAKLAFLKNIDATSAPDFFNLDTIENLANEDMWMEFEDIQIGNWAKTDLRSMAQQAGVKDVYDRYYDWSSGFAHGHWIAVRETAFVTCMNPLHRFHRIPGAPLATLPSVLPDAARLLNRMLDRLNALYPSIKTRLQSHKKLSKETPSAPEPTASETSTQD